LISDEVVILEDLENDRIATLKKDAEQGENKLSSLRIESFSEKDYLAKAFTAIRLRPRARRALNTLRPPGVDMRSKKP
jgi:hypothetical protein